MTQKRLSTLAIAMSIIAFIVSVIALISTF